MAEEAGESPEGMVESEDMERAMPRTEEMVERPDTIFAKHLSDVGKI